MKRASFRNDLELLFVVLCWAFNITVVKVCLGEMAPLAFNALRFVGASFVLLVLTRAVEGSVRIARADMPAIFLLGMVGHTFYQLFFVLGLARATASSTALIFGSTPVVVGLLARWTGQEKMGLAGAAGAALAFYGVSLVARGSGQPEGGGVQDGWLGPVLIFCAVICWSIYTVLSKRLLERYTPLRVTAVTLSIGAVFLVPMAIPDLRGQDWSVVSAKAWSGLVYSFLFALVVCYVLWYRSVKLVGNLRTAIYSNLVPVLGALFGIWLLGEKLTRGLSLGALCILAGIVLTRRGGAGREAQVPAAEA